MFKTLLKIITANGNQLLSLEWAKPKKKSVNHASADNEVLRKLDCGILKILASKPESRVRPEVLKVTLHLF